MTNNTEKDRVTVALSETPHLWGLAIAQAWRKFSRRLRMGRFIAGVHRLYAGPHPDRPV
ncbi:hypothetical protein [Brucella suis]|uniref:hypothetical protein n=1 Tax=Brucella suis TaxID=29461 RepID=UPI0015EEA697|nr:hypothetical protein [Brucella suis]